MVETLVVLGLAAMWAAVLVPPMIRRSVAPRNKDPIGSFAKNMSTLQRNAPVSPSRQAQPFGYSIDLRDGSAPGHADGIRTDNDRFESANEWGMTLADAQARRQNVLASLVAAAVLSFLGAISFGGALMVAHIVVDVALGLYIAALLSVTRRSRPTAASGYSYGSGGSGLGSPVGGSLQPLQLSNSRRESVSR